MDDPKQRKHEPDATVFVSDSDSPAFRAPAQGNESAESSEAATVVGGPLPASPKGADPSTIAGGSSGDMLLQPGATLANRYEIVKVLGQGGMGAVYKARDLHLDREIALKVIRPELANNPEILQRFKQELILARQVTDRNVIRIFDLGEAGRIKFITMEYVEGESLFQILKQHAKLEVAEAADIMAQVASGLAAAHREGVIHRDLKPSNIMRDQNGRVVVMDFGLARSLGSDGMTQSGAMLGTIEYMSPEQAQGKELKPSSDIFAAGLILYEMLSGLMPFHAETAIATLLKRTQQRAVPLVNVDKKIPGVLSNIVYKCLEKDPQLRYQSAEGLRADLRAWQGARGRSKVSASPVRLRMNRVRELPWLRMVITAILIVLTATGIAVYLNRRRPQALNVAAHAPVSVLVADFQNNTGDSLFDDTLEPMFNVALEGASFINAFSRGEARKVAGLSDSHQKLDDKTARLVAVKEGIAAIVSGSLNKHGIGYSLSVKAIDAVTGKTLASADANTENKDALLLEIPKLAVPIRQALGDTTPASVQLGATQGTLSTGSVEALHQYSVGMEQQFQGKWADALKSFTKATQLDPNFARAYAGMAAAAGNLGELQDAEKYAKLAMEHVDRMTERERFRVRGLYYIWTENWQKCVEEYRDLVEEYPADNIGRSNLAACYARILNMPRAMDEARRGLEIAPPNDILARMNFALYSCYASDFKSCEQGAQQVLKINPNYEEAFLVLAYAQLGQNHVPQATETYQKLEKISDWGSSLAAAGFGDLSLYKGNFREGAKILEEGAKRDLVEGKKEAAADKLLMLAYANLLQGGKQGAVAAAERALANSRAVKIRFLAARTYVEVGNIAKAQKLADGLGAEIQISSQAYAKLILGEIALKQHNSNQAIQRFTEAKDLSDTWLGRLDLGRAYMEAEAFGEADSEFDRCIKRRGEALELFMDDAPTYSYLPIVYYYQGRNREGLKSPGFTDSYRTYLSIRGEGTEDPLVLEIHQRLHK